MTFTNTQNSISDLFAPRANDSRSSQAPIERNERKNASDFDALVSDYSPSSQEKVSRKKTQASQNANSATAAKQSEQKSRAKTQSAESTKAQASQKQKTQNTSVKNNKPHNELHNEQAAGKLKRQIAEPTANKVEAVQIENTVKSIIEEQLNSIAIGEASKNASALDLKSGFNAKIDMAFFESATPVHSVGVSGLDALLLDQASTGSGASTTDESNSTKLFGQNKVLDSLAETTKSASFEIPKSSTNQSLLGGNSLNQATGNGLKNISALLNELDIKPIAQGMQNAEAVSATDNLKALEQLNSVKTFAPNIMRTVTAQSAAQNTSQYAAQSNERRTASSNATSSARIAPQQGIPSGIQSPADALINTNAIISPVIQQQNIAGGGLANQSLGAEELIGLDGKVNSVDGLLQIQSESTVSKDASEVKAANKAGNIVLPERFGSLLKSGVQSLKLQIAPKHLGVAELTVKLLNNHVQGTLTVSSEAAKVAALNSIESLSERLSKDGLTLDSLNVEVSDDGGNQAQEELERRYVETLNSGLTHRAFENSNEFFDAASVATVTEQIARPLMTNTINANSVNALA